MEKFSTLTAVAAPLIRANIDTDAIIPSREMKTVSKHGLADGLFAGWRYLWTDGHSGGREPNPEFVLNQPRFGGARIILGGENFGCGSSREHAVWALYEYGIRAIIAPSFAPIFHGNCVRNGLLPVQLSPDIITELAAAVARDPQSNRVSVDLHAQKVSLHAVGIFDFVIDAEQKQMLLEGLDAIDLTLKQRVAIDAFTRRDRQARPWIYLVAP